MEVQSIKNSLGFLGKKKKDRMGRHYLSRYWSLLNLKLIMTVCHKDRQTDKLGRIECQSRIQYTGTLDL